MRLTGGCLTGCCTGSGEGFGASAPPQAGGTLMKGGNEEAPRSGVSERGASVVPAAGLGDR